MRTPRACKTTKPFCRNCYLLFYKRFEVDAQFNLTPLMVVWSRSARNKKKETKQERNYERLHTEMRVAKKLKGRHGLHSAIVSLAVAYGFLANQCGRTTRISLSQQCCRKTGTKVELLFVILLFRFASLRSIACFPSTSRRCSVSNTHSTYLHVDVPFFFF